ncbi:Fanconi anemia core complex-associated protein 24 [Lamellibrachia satsuma]|nr:Fanconi anemia core complex-associated protein 24 [Lamellibrachia satsuma]
MTSNTSKSTFRPTSTIPHGHIITNSKWRGTELATVLQGQVNILYEDDLSLLDFYPSAGMGVVYVTEADVVTGGYTYRSKLAKLRKANTIKVIVLVEKTEVSRQYFWPVQKFVVLELGLTLLPVTSQKEAANMLAALVHAENHPRNNAFIGTAKRKAVSVDEAVLASIQCVPKLGEVKGRLLLEKFHSILGVVEASEQELAQVVGPATASHVKTFFCQPAAPT